MEDRHNTKAVQIRQLDAETGEIIEVYPTIRDAAWDNFISCKTIRKALGNGGYVKTKPLRFEVAN